MRSAKRRVYDILAALAMASATLIAAAARAQTAFPWAAPKDIPAFHPLGEWLRSNVPPSLREVGLFIEHWQWLGLLAAIVLGAVTARLVAMLGFSMGRRVFERVVPGGDNRVVRRSAAALGILLGAGVARAGFAGLGLPKEVFAPLSVAVRFFAAAAIVLTIYRLVDILAAHLLERASRTPSRSDDVLVPLLRKSLQIVVVAIGIVFVAGNVGVDITGLLAGLGIGGLAFALAAQDTVKNLFGSITVLLDKPFQVDDAVVIGTVEGTVEKVGLRSTRIRTPSDSVVTLPNASLISSNVENLGARRKRRWLTRLRVGYDTPPEMIEAFCEGIRELVRREEDTRLDAFEVWANEFGGSAIEIVLSVFFRVPTASAELAARHRLLLNIMRLADHLGVTFALPTTQPVPLLRPGDPTSPAAPADPTSQAKEVAAVITRKVEKPS